MTRTMSYTVVQHSAWSANRDPQFKHALESARITAAQATQVRRQGGLVFGSYTDAEDYADAEQYQNVEGLIARAPGTFASYRIDGRAVYVPVPVVVE